MIGTLTVIAARSTRAAITVLTLCVVLGAPARAATSAIITSSFSDDRLGAKSALTFTIRYVGGEFGVPSAVRRSIVRFPAGFSLDIPNLRSCPAARLRTRGASGCPAQSQIGTGFVLAEVRAGSQVLTEDIVLSAFLGPLQNNQPTLVILGQGDTPLQERVVMTGMMLLDRAPYGERLVMSIPPIPTLPLEPFASTVRFSLTIGAERQRKRNANTVLVPSRCPAGGFPFAADFTYADGSADSAFTTAPCPEKAIRMPRGPVLQ